MAATPTLLPNGKAPNPLYNGLRVRERIDLMPRSFSANDLAVAYRNLTWELEDERLILESAPFDDVDDFYNPGTEDVLDQFILEAITVDHFSRTEKRMNAVVRVLNTKLAGSEIQALPPIVGRPRKSGVYAYVTVQLPFSDGQSVSVVFHSPEGDKQKIGPDDQIIAFRWLLNKRDITHVVAPEDGAEVSLDSIAIRITQLVQKNSAKFARQQKEAFGEVQALQSARDALAAANEQKQEVADSILALTKEYDTVVAQVTNTKRLIEKQQQINAGLEGKIAEAQAKKVAKPNVTVTNGDSSGDPINPTSPEGYSKVLADEALQLQYQDNLDAFFQDRFAAIHGDLKSKGWSDNGPGMEKTAGDSTYRLVFNFKQVGAGKNLVGMGLKVFIGKEVFYDYVDDLTLDPEDIVNGADSAAAPQASADTSLPPGWTEATPGGLATNTDPVSGGIVDTEIASGKWFVIPEDSSLGKLEGFDSRAEAFKALADAVAAKAAEPKPEPAPSATVPVLPSKDQMSNPAKRASKILYAHGWEEKAMEPGFHAVLGNPPYQDLSIETQSDENDMLRILFTQYTEMGGDLVIDSEIVFRVSPTYGMLKQIQTAGRGPAGEFRGNDSVFGNVITKNYIGAGFDKPGKVTVKSSVGSGEGDEGSGEPERVAVPVDMFSLGTEVEVNFGTEDAPEWKRGKYMGGHEAKDSGEWHYVDFSDIGLDPLTSVMGSTIRKAADQPPQPDPHRGNDGDNETRPDPDNTPTAGDEGTPVIEPTDPISGAHGIGDAGAEEPAVEPTPQPEPTPPAEPAAVGVLRAIVAGDYDRNPQALDEALDGAAAELEAAGLMDAWDALLNEAADKAAAVAIEAAKKVA